MGTSGGPGKIDSLNYGGDMASLANSFRNKSGKLFREAFPLYKEASGQAMEALRTGGIGAAIPSIQRAVESSRMQTDAAVRGAEDHLAPGGLSGTPFGARILEGIRAGGDINTSRIPTEIAESRIAGVPALASGGLGAAGQFGGLSSGTLANLQQLDLTRQLSNSDQFRSFMEALKDTAMKSASMGMCCHPETPIATPSGDRRIADLTVDDDVWTLDDFGKVIRGRVVEMCVRPRDGLHRFAILPTPDGDLLISGDHPLADGTALRAHPAIRGYAIASDALVTMDLRVSGPTGVYFALGVPLGSTLDSRFGARQTHRRVA